MIEDSTKSKAAQVGQPLALVGAPAKHPSAVVGSSLRNGTALDGLVPNRPFENSLLERSALCPVEPPIDPSTSFTRCSRFERQLKKATEAVVQCEPHELATVGRTAIAQFHQPKDKEISGIM